MLGFRAANAFTLTERDSVIVSRVQSIDTPSIARESESVESDLSDYPLWRLSLELGPSYDMIWAYGRHSFTEVSGDSVLCVTTVTRDRGSGQHLGFSGGLLYGPLGARVRYSDLSGHYDTIGYEFRTLGLELSLHPLLLSESWRGSVISNFVDASITCNLDGRINTFTEGLGSTRNPVKDARVFMPRFGASVSGQFRIYGDITIGPEIQLKWSPYDLVPGDWWGSALLSAIIKVPLNFAKKILAPPAPPVASPLEPFDYSFIAKWGSKWVVYHCPAGVFSKTTFDKYLRSCLNEDLAPPSPPWAKEIGDGAVISAHILEGYHYVFAIRKNGRLFDYSEPEQRLISRSSKPWVIEFTGDWKKCP